MNELAVFFAGSGLLALLALVVVLNFYRFRFKGDATFAIIILFFLSLLASMAVTFMLFVPAGSTVVESF